MRSIDSLDTLTDASNELMHTKVIIEMQETLKQLKEEQQLLRDYIGDMESTVITLVEADTESESYQSAATKAKQLKRKREKEDPKKKQRKQEKNKETTVRRSKRLAKSESEDIVKDIREKEKLMQEKKGETQLDEKETRQEMDVDNKQDNRRLTKN